LIDRVGQFINKSPAKLCRVLVPMGGRVDILSAVSNRLAVSAGSLQQFTVQLTAGAEVQKVRKKCGFMQVGIAGEVLESGAHVPCSIPAQAARARRGECTRLRCMDRLCPLRPVGEALEKDKEVDSAVEMNQDDLEVIGVDDCVEEEVVEVSEVEEALLAPPSRRDCIVDLWPFAFGRDFYKQLFDAVAPQESISHCVVLSTSAHPAPWLAAFDAGMNVHVVLDRVKAHSKNHGMQIFKKCLSDVFTLTERAKVDASAKRLRSQDLHFVVVAAPEEQPLKFSEVAPDAQLSGWRAGFNSWPESDVLEKVSSVFSVGNSRTSI